MRLTIRDKGFIKPSARCPVLLLRQTAVTQKAAIGIFNVSFPPQLAVAVCFQMSLFAPTAVGAERDEVKGMALEIKTWGLIRVQASKHQL